MATVLDKTALTTASADDILYIVDDPAGTPLDKKITAQNLFNTGVGLLTGNVALGVAATRFIFPDGSSSLPSITFAGRPNEDVGIWHDGAGNMQIRGGGSGSLTISNGGHTAQGSFGVKNNDGFDIYAGDGSNQVKILSDGAAHTLGQRNGTNAQTFRVYGTFTDASNYERAALITTAGTGIELAAQTAGTGADNLDITLTPAGTGGVLLTGDITITKADPSIIFIPATATDTRFWMGIQEDALSTDDDTFQIGRGVTPGAGVLFKLGRDNDATSLEINTPAAGGGARLFRGDGGAARFVFSSVSAEGQFVADTDMGFGLRSIGHGITFEANSNVVEQRNGTNAQTLRLYDTFASASDYHRAAFKTARATLSNVSGASVTATNLIPDGAIVVGVTTKVTTGLGTGNGTTGYQVGDGVDADRWGAITGTAAGTSSDNRDWTATTVQAFTAANNVVLTATGGNFDGTGVIYVSVQYLIGECD